MGVWGVDPTSTSPDAEGITRNAFATSHYGVFPISKPPGAIPFPSNGHMGGDAFRRGTDAPSRRLAREAPSPRGQMASW